MVALSLISNTLGIINGVGAVLTRKGNPTGSKLQKVGALGDKAFASATKFSEVGGAITQLSRQTTILSRVFIDESVLDEIVLPNVMKSTHEWYAAQILAALQLSTFVDGKRTVQDMMSVVQTGDNEHRESVLGNIIKRSMGMESLVSNLLGDEGLEAMPHHLGGPGVGTGLQMPAKTGHASAHDNSKTLASSNARLTKDNAKLTEENERLKAVSPSAQLKSVNVSEHRMGPMGELFEVTLNNPKNGENAVKVPLYIQMQPSVIPVNVAPRFIDMNVAPSLWQRWTQMRAGEITFWKDFIGARDLIKKQKAIVKDPETAAAFSEFLRSVHKKDAYALVDITDRTLATHSQNLANSVMIFNEDTVMQAKVDSAIDLHNAKDRARYFQDTYTMCLIIIDAIHQRVTVYFNGIDGELDCSYADFRPKDSKFDPKDFMNALTAFSTNSIGRLR